MIDQKTFFSEAQEFLALLFSDLELKRIKLDYRWTIDHLCYRSSTEKDYHELKLLFSSLGSLLIESVVNGRLISTYKLHQPLFYKSWKISLLELPAPKKDRVFKNGFEHIEVVVDVSFEALKNEYPQLAFKESGLKKTINKELELPLGDRAIKFHHLSLESVINLEKNKRVFELLNKIGILETFKDFDPFVLGPALLDPEQVEISILLNVRNLAELEKELEKQFLIEERLRDEVQFNCQFEIENVIFKIFAEPKAITDQERFKFFQKQERIVHLLSD